MLLKEHVEELSSLQRLHYASKRYPLLLIFQAMDAASKDSAIRNVMFCRRFFRNIAAGIDRSLE